MLDGNITTNDEDRAEVNIILNYHYNCNLERVL